MANTNRNEYVGQELQVRGLENPMQNFKEEVAAEIGLTGYNNMDKGWLSSRQNGYVGGNMTKKMVALAEQIISQQGSQVVSSIPTVEVSPEVRQLNELASQDFGQYTQMLQGINNQQLQ